MVVGKGRILLAERPAAKELGVSTAQDITKLERTAISDPESRLEIQARLWTFSRAQRRSGSLERHAKEAAERIAALDMLEILHGEDSTD